MLAYVASHLTSCTIALAIGVGVLALYIAHTSRRGL